VVTEEFALVLVMRIGKKTKEYAIGLEKAEMTSE
jgi:hypothetical protein